MPDAHHPHAFSRIAEELVADLRGIASEEPKRSRKRETQPLAAVVEQLLQKHQIGRSTPEDALRERWVEIVGAANASYSHAVTIERNRLLVVTSHAIVRNELFLHKEQILRRIQAVKGCEHVKSIHLRNG